MGGHRVLSFCLMVRTVNLNSYHVLLESRESIPFNFCVVGRVIFVFVSKVVDPNPL